MFEIYSSLSVVGGFSGESVTLSLDDFLEKRVSERSTCYEWLYLIFKVCFSLPDEESDDIDKD